MENNDLLLGYDLGSSSVKVSVIDASTGRLVASATYPKEEMRIDSPVEGWAEQHPDDWWEHVVAATQEIKHAVDLSEVRAIGIAYQMHGLVLVDREHRPLRPSIIWCDSRAVAVGQRAFDELGTDYCLSHLLNSPGNFTAAKLRWVKENEPHIFEKVHKFMLPGDYLAMKMTGEIRTTVSGLSEGIFWDFKEGRVSDKLLAAMGLEASMIPDLVETFGKQGELTAQAAAELGLPAGIPISYRAGDQPNNAFSLNVLQPGEVAATAGTSGVVYGITDRPDYDPQSRVNTFVHVNHAANTPRYGVLLCVNGTGILNSWFKNHMTGIQRMSYEQMNQLIAQAPIGAEGLSILPFGNGAERILGNQDIKSQVHGLNFTRHTQQHMFRAMQEGIVFALNYGFGIMQQMGLRAQTVRAGHANMFLSPIFRETFANITGASVELYNTDGAQGAARGAGLGAGLYGHTQEAFQGLKTVLTVEPNPQHLAATQEAYDNWLNVLRQYT